MTITRVLVTGATGFIGRRLVQRLVESGLPVTILMRETVGQGRPLPSPLATLRPQLDVAYADLRNYSLTSQAVRAASPSHVIHLAAAGVSDPFLPPETALRHNLDGTLNLLRACFAAPGLVERPRQLISGRTPGEQSAMNVYAASKAAAWSFCQMYARTQGWPIHGATIFQAYGPGQPAQMLIPSALAAALAGADFPMTAGAQERDWIYLDDVVDGLLAALDADLPPGETFELGTGRLTPVVEVVQKIFELASRLGRPLVGVLPGRPGEEARQAADAGRSRELIGWQAAVSLEEGLRRLYQQATGL
ncbi:MAG: SDR family NAD(P)-dependent oxidoreductase [Chloroflexi bacterium]|nr:SDR family NAD(P)-dependent oxidoreductase [Chloroflexota bacterium]MCI0577610.1 SDR family NAD(P)-dependent oxidoreductase [Chloroflexota bacterium]MCI0644170.1 SDR family NAD(P)-dependent oxidoreductase [Chloroflexota bacterium]MCI0725247.1 SDR family NAD(P)-dependent oxidoreductase [Chloroflexota bacterium]